MLTSCLSASHHDAPPPAHAAPTRCQGGTAGTGSVRVTSAQLLKNRHELEIEHAGSIYRLRLTGAGKLILTK